jgi:hypothetical protein
MECNNFSMAFVFKLHRGYFEKVQTLMPLASKQRKLCINMCWKHKSVIRCIVYVYMIFILF